MKYIRIILVQFSILAAVLILNSCENGDARATKTEEKIKEYAVLNIQTQPVSINVEYPATIIGQQNVEIRSRVDGFIEQIYVDEGAVVRKGQLLFRLDSRQLSQTVLSAEAAIKVAQAEVSSAELQVEKVKYLTGKSIVSHYELETAQNTLKSKQAILAQAQANLQNARTSLSFTRITSPVNGIIGNIPFKVGALVGSSTAQALTTVSDNKNIYAYFSMNEKDFLSLVRSEKGKPASKILDNFPEVSLLLADGSVYQYTGKIETVSGLINAKTGSANFRAVFKNPDNIIRSGSSAVVRIPRYLDSAIIIPQKATYELQGKVFTYLLDNSGKIKNIEISVLPISNGQFYVVTKGLNIGDKVVIEGVNSLKNGMTIKPKTINQDSIYKKIKDLNS